MPLQPGAYDPIFPPAPLSEFFTDLVVRKGTRFDKKRGQTSDEPRGSVFIDGRHVAGVWTTLWGFPELEVVEAVRPWMVQRIGSIQPVKQWSSDGEYMLYARCSSHICSKAVARLVDYNTNWAQRGEYL